MSHTKLHIFIDVIISTSLRPMMTSPSPSFWDPSFGRYHHWPASSRVTQSISFVTPQVSLLVLLLFYYPFHYYVQFGIHWQFLLPPTSLFRPFFLRPTLVPPPLPHSCELPSYSWCHINGITPSSYKNILINSRNDLINLPLGPLRSFRSTIL